MNAIELNLENMVKTYYHALKTGTAIDVHETFEMMTHLGYISIKDWEEFCNRTCLWECVGTTVYVWNTGSPVFLSC